MLMVKQLLYHSSVTNIPVAITRYSTKNEGKNLVQVLHCDAPSEGKGSLSLVGDLHTLRHHFGAIASSS